ncbi:MAG TPA: glycosyltransferase [Acidimicrobiales bacterium]|nr:glycosyltransferase [Acidimicrobiales bacterium]
MRQALWVTSEAPDFRVGGGSIRQAHLLAGLARRFDQVDLVLAGHLSDPEVAGLLGPVSEVDFEERRAPSSVAARRLEDVWKAVVGRRPAEVHDRRLERAALRRHLEDRVAGGSDPPYDVVHVEHLGLAGIVPAGVGRRSSLDVQNVPSRMAVQAAALAPGRRQRGLLRAEAAAARRFQARALDGLDLLSAVSAADVADLTGATVPAPGGPAVMVVPNGVDLSRFPVAPLPAAPRLVFTGTLDFLPNEDGIVWFTDHVLPLVRDRIPDVTLAIAGRRPTAAVRALAGRPGVRLQIDVADMGAVLAGSRVAVVPVRIGTGSRLKALEAMAAGRPVAGTSVGLEGIEIEPGTHALVADDPAALAAAVVDLCRHDERASGIGRAGRSLVETTYAWAGIEDRFADAVFALTAG